VQFDAWSDTRLGRAERPGFAGAGLNHATERTIAISRLVLAAGGLLAAYADPAQPSQGEAGYVFLGLYVLFSLGMLTTVSKPLEGARCIAAHVVEIGLICIVIAYTEGPTSPFFVYFTFALLTATLRWQWRGALMTGAALSLVLIGLTVTQLISNPASADLDRLIVRNLYLLVASALFAVLGEHLVRSRQRQTQLRLAHELHDGVLQTLTAVRLKLHAIASAASGRERASLVEATELLDEEQRQIREFVEASRQSPPGGQRPRGLFPITLLGLFARHLERLWECKVDLTIADADIGTSQELGTAIKLVLGEAVANAVVHGKATSVAINVADGQHMIVLTVADNGTGLPASEGHYDDAQLAACQLGPRSLRERAAALGGSLELDNSTKGVTLHFTLPNPPQPEVAQQ
jgi:signal transduction histidine kinase